MLYWPHLAEPPAVQVDLMLIRMVVPGVCCGILASVEEATTAVLTYRTRLTPYFEQFFFTEYYL